MNLCNQNRHIEEEFSNHYEHNVVYGCCFTAHLSQIDWIGCNLADHLPNIDRKEETFVFSINLQPFRSFTLNCNTNRWESQPFYIAKWPSNRHSDRAFATTGDITLVCLAIIGLESLQLVRSFDLACHFADQWITGRNSRSTRWPFQLTCNGFGWQIQPTRRRGPIGVEVAC